MTVVMATIEVVAVTAQAGPQVPADLVSYASEAVADGLAGGLAAAPGLVEHVAKIVGKRARQGPDVLGHLPELLVPGHIKRLRRSPRFVIHPGLESVLLPRADPATLGSHC
jgi:hypothetical protein